MVNIEIMIVVFGFFPVSLISATPTYSFLILADFFVGCRNSKSGSNMKYILEWILAEKKKKHNNPVSPLNQLNTVSLLEFHLSDIMFQGEEIRPETVYFWCWQCALFTERKNVRLVRLHCHYRYAVFLVEDIFIILKVSSSYSSLYPFTHISWQKKTSGTTSTFFSSIC